MVTGHIRMRKCKNSKKTYQVIIETDKDPLTGKRQRLYKTVNGTKKEAEAELDRMKNELNNGGIIKPSALKLKDWLDEWLNVYMLNIEATTKAGYTERINNRIIPYLGNIPLKNLENSAVQRWVNCLSNDGLSPKSVKNVFLNLKASLDKAVELKKIPSNPCNGVVLPKQVKYEATVYDAGEINELLTVAKDTDMFLLVMLEIFTGLRRGEIAELKWSDIDFENSMIRITRSKVMAGGKKKIKAPKSSAGKRIIGIGDNLKEVLESEYTAYLEDKATKEGYVDSGYVIRQPNGEGFSPDSLTQKWIRFRKKHNLKEIRLHDLRHTCATAMLNAGVDFKIIQTRLGHADISTTMNIYAHCLPSINKEAGNKIEALLNLD